MCVCTAMRRPDTVEKRVRNSLGALGSQLSCAKNMVANPARIRKGEMLAVR